MDWFRTSRSCITFLSPLRRVEHWSSGRYMEVQSTNLTVFVYSNYFMEELLGDQPCKDGVVYKKFGAIELMPMGYPDAVNHVGHNVNIPLQFTPILQL